MQRFSVWAPLARRVAVDVAGAQSELDRDGGGWWSGEVAGARPGDDYWFVVDGGRLPDPRSPWQPAGIDGPSRTVDHSAFPWTDHGWRGVHLPSSVIYELHVGTFTPGGTFDSAIERLDHLTSLGVTAVELLPVAEFSGVRGWGYDGVDLYAPHHAYGGPDGLKRFVDACHQRGLGVVMDVVYNHLGPAGNHLSRFGPYFTDRYTTPWGEAVNFDGPGSDEVRAFFVDNALLWLRDYHCDGLRLDAVHAIVDTSATHILEEIAERVDVLAAELGRPLFLIAESDLNDPRVVRRREVGGYGLDAQWSDDFHHALHSVLTGERSGYYEDFGSMGQLATAIRQAFVYAGEHSPHRGRRHGRLDPSLPGHRFLGYIQNHDQIGNRALGERMSMLVGLERLRAAAALVLTAPFVPMLFQGEEWGASTPFQYFTAHEDAELGRAVSEGRRREFSSFGWDPEDVPDPQDVGTFERSRLDWEELERAPHRELLAWHRELIGLRRRLPELADHRLDQVRAEYDEDRRWIVVRRGALTVACNLGDAAVTVAARGELLLGCGAATQAGSDTVDLAPGGVALVRDG